MSEARRYLEVSVTYERVTPESAEHGDVEERGFMVAGSQSRFFWRMPIEEALGESVSELLTAHDVLRVIRSHHCCYSASVSATGATFGSAEPQDEDHVGAKVEYTVHVEGPERLVRALVRAAKPCHVNGR